MFRRRAHLTQPIFSSRTPKGIPLQDFHRSTARPSSRSLFREKFTLFGVMPYSVGLKSDATNGRGRGGCFSLSALISLTEAVHETQEVTREHNYLGGIHGIGRYVAMTLRVFVSGNSAGKEVHHSLLLRRWQ